MLNSIRIGNFKAFAEPQSIPIRPLTLIYGANSSGKSSILHSLILAHHAQETGNIDVHRTNVGGEAVDLGGFRQFIHRRDANLSVNWVIELSPGSFTDQLMDISIPETSMSVAFSVGIALGKQQSPLTDVQPEVNSFEIFTNKLSLMRFSRRSDGKLQLDRLNHENQVFQILLKTLIDDFFSDMSSSLSFNSLNHAIEQIVPKIVASTGKFLPERLEDLIVQKEDFRKIEYDLDQGSRNENLELAIGQHAHFVVDSLLSEITGTIYAELSRLKYLGPLRSYPPRSLVFSQHHDPNWRAGGGYAWDVVRSNSQVRKLINEWLSYPNRLQTPYELVVRELVGIDELEEPLTSGLEEVEIDLEVDYDSEFDVDLGKRVAVPTGEYPVINNLEAEAAKLCEHIRDSDIDKLNELIMIDRRSNTLVSHRDIGIGVSQVLPVLVEAYASQNQIIAVEQPEIHLHPALQADLGDVFIQSALGESKNHFLIESHSEHLLLRIMRRMRQTGDDELPEGFPKVTPKDVCILFVQPMGSSSVVRQMKLDEEGRLLDAWPGGFFEEGYRERFE